MSWQTMLVYLSILAVLGLLALLFVAAYTATTWALSTLDRTATSTSQSARPALLRLRRAAATWGVV